MKTIKKYETPDFDVTIYEIEDSITSNESVTGGDIEFGPDDPNGDEGRFGG